MPRVEEFNRDEVLLKAMHIFWEKGYNGTSMQDLVEGTGLNRSSVYNSFGSKLELYQETLKKYKKGGNAQFQRVLMKAKNPLEAIQLIFESFIPEIIGDVKSKGCYVMNCKSEMGNQNEDIRKMLIAAQEDTLSVFQELIADGQQQGLINSDQDSKSYAYHIFSAFQGFRMTGILVKDRKVLQEIIVNAIKVII